jgi:hypothetical protein
MSLLIASGRWLLAAGDWLFFMGQITLNCFNEIIKLFT